jgi:hypothetical protein
MSEVIKAFLEDEAEQIGNASGFVERRSKMSGRVFAQTLILGWIANPDASLNELVQWSARLGVDISEAGLHQRLNRQAVAFLAGLLERGLQLVQGQTGIAKEILTRFNGVYLLDSTLITLPAQLSEVFAGSGRTGSASALKIQLSYEYQTGGLHALRLEAGRYPDQKCELIRLTAFEGSLHLFDLGFFKVATFEGLAQAGAFFLSRLQVQTALYQSPQETHALDLAKVLAIQPAQRGELSVFMGHSTRLPVRLIFQKLPPDVVEERRRKARANAQQRGQTPSQRHLALLAYALFITNVPPDWLSPLQVCQLYRLRWQVELIFKLWKSQAHLDRFHPWRPERILCQCFARLLGLLLFHTFIAPWRFISQPELSFPKAWRILQSYMLPFALALHAHALLVPLFASIVRDFLRFAPASSRKSPLRLFVAFSPSA